MRSGLSPVCPTTAPLTISGYARVQLDRHARAAAARGQFRIQWQPLVNCRTDALSEFEAAWWPEPHRFTVTVSAGWCDGQDLSFEIENVLRATKLNPARPELESIEPIPFGSTGLARPELAYLKAPGVDLSLGNFGTSFFSPGTIALDKTRLDRRFIETSGTGRPAKVTAHSRRQRITGVRMQVCAEGVELRSHLGMQQTCQCAEVGAYLIGRPAALNSDTLLTYARLGDHDMVTV